MLCVVRLFKFLMISILFFFGIQVNSRREIFLFLRVISKRMKKYKGVIIFYNLLKSLSLIKTRRRIPKIHTVTSRTLGGHAHFLHPNLKRLILPCMSNIRYSLPVICYKHSYHALLSSTVTLRLGNSNRVRY